MHLEEAFETTEMRNQDVICVLGMHRSGTSLLTRILNLIGVYLGTDRAVTAEPAAYNPKGHWEHKEITQICDTILNRHGGSWDHPPLFPRGWETATEMEDLRCRTRQLIEDQFSKVPLWGWKDPRTCLTLPFWQQLIPQMRYVICMRNPVDVAHSLAHRDSFSAQKSFYLWLTYVSSTLNQTLGKSRLVVFYEDLIDDGLGESLRLAEFLGKPERAKLEDVQAEVQGFLEKGLQHYRTSLANTAVSSRIDLYARTLYIAQRISLSLECKNRSLNKQTSETLEALSQYSEYDGALAKQLSQLTYALRSHSEDASEMAQSLSAALIEIQTQLPRVQDKLHRRLMTRYRHTKSYLLPIYRELVKPLAVR